MSRNGLTKRESSYMDFIDSRGHVSPANLQIHFGVERSTVTRMLQSLWLKGQVARPQKGLIISRKWLTENRHIAKWINDNIGDLFD